MSLNEVNKELSAQTTLSHYRIVSKIGAGGMGEVYLAQDTKLDRKVALKILPADVASNRDRMERFVREAKSAAALNHPNIAHIYEIGESEGTNFIAMEFIDGLTLRELIHGRQTDLSKLLRYLQHVAEGLAKAHAAGIVHRDLKPDNIMITRDDYAKVLDFGLAKLVEPQRTFESGQVGSSEVATAIMQQQSIPGMVMGTIGYMSPEQASGRVNEIDHRSDIFSFGCILFEAATGQRAFEGKDALDSLHKIVHAPTPQLKDVNPLAPDDLQRVVRRCLAKEPEKRYQSMKEVALELDDLQQELKGLAGAEYSSSAASSTKVTTSVAARADEGFWVAVLPFKARDADPGVAALADGLSEEIVTGLSRFRYLSVVTSASAARLKGETGDERALGAKLGARYGLQGSISKGGSAIRVSAQLVDTETGAQLWAETYSRDLQTSTIFAVQDDIAGRIVATVADSYGVLVHSMRAAIRQKDDADLTPVEWQFQYCAYREQITPSALAALKSRLLRVAERNDGQSNFWACLAQIYVDEYAFGFQDDATSLDRALAAGRRGVELDRANQFALVALAQVHFFRQDLAAFGPAAERAMALNPLNTDALGILGLQIVHTGEFERGTAIVRRAMELNPNHAGWMHFAPLWDHFNKGEYEQALECANRVDVPGLFWPYLVMASACGHLDRRAEASAAVRDLLALDPEFAAHVRPNVESWHFASGLMDPILEGLRKAGLSIPATDGSSDSPMGTVTAKADRAEPGRDSGAVRADEGFWVAVLPFKCAGASAEIKGLADGLSEEIVTGLSRFSYLRVIARGSTAKYSSEAGDVRAIGKELGARYVMEGTVRQAGTKLRVTVQLVDAISGAHLWAENYERSFSAESVFELQDELVPRIVSTVADLHGVLPHSMSEVVRLKPPDQLSPYEAVLRSFGYTERVTAEELADALACLELAVQKVPSYPDALAMLASYYTQDHGQGFDLRTDPLLKGENVARKAVEIAPGNHLAWISLAQVHFFQKEFQTFTNAAERAVALNPMDGNSMATLGELLTFSGNWERGLELVERAKQLNPNHPGWYWYVNFHRAYQERDYESALDFALKVNLPSHWVSPATIAASYGQLGQREAAAKAVRDMLKLRPEVASTVRMNLEKWWTAEDVELFIEGLRKAGLQIPGEERRAEAAAPMEKRTAIEPSRSIAVLPFANISNDEENEYFCDGLAEELLNALAKIEDLKVAARTSAFWFKGKNMKVAEIGDALHVNTVLEGSVRKSGNRLRITVQLVNATDGYHLWSERYDREMKDIFDVQDEITLAVVDALKVKLLGEEQGAVLKRHTRNPEAHEFYLRGLFYFNRFTPDDFQKAGESFRRAIAIDPRYASAYAGLADAYTELCFFSFSPSEAMPKAREAANKALELDDRLGEAHKSLAIIKMYFDWDYAGAEQEFKRAIALNPGSALIHMWYGWYLGLMGRFDESFKEMQGAQDLDPLSATNNSGIGIVFHWSRQPERAIEQFRKVLELNPNYPIACSFLAEAYEQKGDFVSAIATIEKIQLAATDPLTLSTVGYVYAKSGDRHKALEILNEFVKRSNQEYVPALNFAQIYAGLGDNEQALAWLDKACNERAVWIPFLKVDLKFDPLRDDPRFQQLLKKVGFPR